MVHEHGSSVFGCAIIRRTNFRLPLFGGSDL
jgi:hypothetical protein